MNFVANLLITLLIFFISLQFGNVPNVLGKNKVSNESLNQLLVNAKKYWQGRLTGDFITCYNLEEPNYRKSVPLSSYAKRRGIIYKEIHIQKPQIQGNTATVEVIMYYIIPAMGNHMFKMTVKDPWVIIEGKWYHQINNKERR